MISLATVKREVKIHFRSSWTYSFIVLLTLFTVLIMYLYGNIAGIGQYTKATGTLMNLLAYFLPLMTLVMGAFSLTMEKEDGSWLLLRTYPISTTEWIIGKMIGLWIVLLTAVTLAFSIGGIVGYFTNLQLSFYSIVMLYGFSCMIVILFLAMSTFIGVISKNRWQALSISVSLWLLFVLAWPMLLMATLHTLTYKTLLHVLQFATFVNPLEFTRIFFVVKLGGGQIFGPEYIEWVTWVMQPSSVLYYIGLSIIWIVVMISLSVLVTQRSRYHGT